MKKKNLFFVFSALFVSFVLFSKCDKDTDNQKLKNGYINIELGVNIHISDIDNHLKSVVDVGDYTVIVYTEGGSEVISYAHASDMPDQIPLDPGDYYVVAHSNNMASAEFENPYYYGSSSVFTIEESEEEQVTVNCELANCKVSVIYSANVISDFDDYATEVSNDNASLTFEKDETRSGYFELSAITINAVLTYLKGDGTTEVKTLNGSIPSPEAKKHYEIHIDASRDEGSSAVSISIDETTSTELISLSEEEEDDGLSYGDVLITEIMSNPGALSDTEGEWFEVYNNSSADIDLQNLVIRKIANTTTQYHTISESIVLSPGDYYVLAKSESATNASQYVFGSDISLNNSDTEIAILTYGTDGTDGVELSSVFYDSSFPLAEGISMNLDPDHYNADEAKIGANWCEATEVYTVDLGTPGLANSDCDL